MPQNVPPKTQLQSERLSMLTLVWAMGEYFFSSSLFTASYMPVDFKNHMHFFFTFTHIIEVNFIFNFASCLGARHTE